MSTSDRLLILCCALFIGLSVALLQTYEHFRQIAETAVVVTGVASFVLAVFEFFRKNN